VINFRISKIVSFMLLSTWEACYSSFEKVRTRGSGREDIDDISKLICNDELNVCFSIALQIDNFKSWGNLHPDAASILSRNPKSSHEDEELIWCRTYRATQLKYLYIYINL
jgi:hypothetical protein